MLGLKCVEKKIILIVEDQAELRDSLRKLIASWGYRVVTADTLQEAILKAANQKFNLIILDISLHKASGLKLLEQTRRSDLNINYFTPIIIHSGYVEVDIFDKYKSEFNDVLIKPSSIEKIKEKINYWSEKKHNCKSHNTLFINEYSYMQTQLKRKQTKAK